MNFDTIKLDKGLYTSAKGFTKSLEEIDPSENYIGTELEGLDAYERQLKRFNIKVSGKESDTVSKFFETSDSAVLFPEYLARAIRVGLSNNILDDLVATTTVIDSLDYRSIECVDNGDEIDPNGRINEGAFIPETYVKTKENLTQLHKNGRMLVASYEAIKTQKLDLFTVSLKQIGNRIAQCEAAQALQTLTANAKALKYGTTKAITYSDFIDLWKTLSPYEMNTVVAESGMIGNILQLAEFKDANAGQNFHGTGELVTPLGAKLIYSHSGVLGDGVLALDRRYALEKVQLGDVVTDFDKLIDRQLERATVTCTSGFNTILSDASAIIKS